MKKFFALIFSLLCVGMIFVGCSKEGDKYFYDVYDFWKAKVDAVENEQFYKKDVEIVFGDNINKFISSSFSQINQYQETFCKIKSDVELLSFEFVHDPKLEGKELKNAQNKVTSYKEQLKSYEDEIDDFKNAKRKFEAACENLDFEEAGIIEKDEYKTFLAEFGELINSVDMVFSKMYDCAKAMFYSGKVSGFESNNERISSIKENYFGTKVALAKDFVFFCYNNSNSTQSVSEKQSISSYYDQVQSLELTNESLGAVKQDSELSTIDSKLEMLHVWLDYYTSESEEIKDAIASGQFKYSINGIKADTLENAIIIQNHEKYSNFVKSIMKNLSETCASLVAFY